MDQESGWWSWLRFLPVVRTNSSLRAVRGSAFPMWWSVRFDSARANRTWRWRWRDRRTLKKKNRTQIMLIYGWSLSPRIFDEKAKSHDAEKALQKYEAAVKVWEQKSKGEKRKDKSPNVNRNWRAIRWSIRTAHRICSMAWSTRWCRMESVARSGSKESVMRKPSKAASCIKLSWKCWLPIGGRDGVSAISRLSQSSCPIFVSRLKNRFRTQAGWCYVSLSWKVWSWRTPGSWLRPMLAWPMIFTPRTSTQSASDWRFGLWERHSLLWAVAGFVSIRPVNSERNGRCRVYFEHSGDELKAAGGEKKITGFAIAGSDKVFHPADARFNKKSG